MCGNGGKVNVVDNNILETISTLENLLGRRVDLADINGLNEIGKKYILPEVLYVQ